MSKIGPKYAYSQTDEHTDCHTFRNKHMRLSSGLFSAGEEITEVSHSTIRSDRTE